MAGLTELEQWEEQIYQIETTDPVVGGQEGISNRQAKQLANRTKYLKKTSSPAGAVAHFAMAAAPDGWIKCNGAAISRTAYAGLFAAIGTGFGVGDGSTTFNVPDLRGEFLRGYDDARGVDSGRVFGSTQDSQNLSHEHTVFGTGARSDHRLTFESPGTNICTDPMVKVAATVYPANDASGRSSDFMARVSGGGESRPRNMALLACIKY